MTWSPSPLDYDTSSKETVGNRGRSRSTRKSRMFTCALSCYTRKSRTFTCAISRYMRKSRTSTCVFSRTSYAQVVHRTHKSLQAHKSLTRKIRTFTYALSRFKRTDVPRTHEAASSAQAVYIRNKSLTRTSRTIHTQ